MLKKSIPIVIRNKKGKTMKLKVLERFMVPICLIINTICIIIGVALYIPYATLETGLSQKQTIADRSNCNHYRWMDGDQEVYRRVTADDILYQDFEFMWSGGMHFYFWDVSHIGDGMRFSWYPYGTREGLPYGTKKDYIDECKVIYTGEIW